VFALEDDTELGLSLLPVAESAVARKHTPTRQRKKGFHCRLIPLLQGSKLVGNNRIGHASTIALTRKCTGVIYLLVYTKGGALTFLEEVLHPFSSPLV
jgi:hypothetical protein